MPDSEIDISALSGAPAAESPYATMWQEKGFIGSYQLVQPIGAGGMGEVWLAEQTHPVRRRVALKLIKAGMDTGEVMQRFQSERQALALMNHPAIAKVFDAGSTPQGRPYFAMEYIPGIPITTYCDQRKLGVRARLELFVQVCDGVQHAHQKAILHRDLKPSNILVTEVDGKPRARIIDFGVAKAMEQPLTAETLYTRAGVVVGTPAYMSPEQAGSSGSDVDTRTDVYSLGVVLYELLVGERPLDFHGLTFEGVLRRLLEDEPSRPSAKVPELRGDLDAITLKALEKDRARRYASPSGLAADIERYLHHEAVQAVTPTRLYRARKFARRYRVALATTAAFVVVLIAAAAISIRQSVVAIKQRDRADKEAAVAQAVSDFLKNDLLAQAGVKSQWGMGGHTDPDLKVRTALDRAAERISGKFKRQPEVEAAIRETIGESYAELGLNLQSRGQFERALELYRLEFGQDDPRTLRTRSRVASQSIGYATYAQVEAQYKQVLAIQRRVLGPEHSDTLGSMFGLAFVYRDGGKYAESEALLREILPSVRRAFGPDNPHTLECMDRLAQAYYRQGKYAKAEELSRRVFEIRRRVFGLDFPETTVSLSDLGNVYRAEGQFAQAAAIYQQTLEIRRRVMGPEHPFVMAAMNNLAQAYLAQGKYREAEALDTQALEVRRRVMGPQSPETLMSMENLAADYSHQKKYRQAEALFARTLEIDVRALGPQSRFTLDILSEQAFMYQVEGKFPLAEASAAQALAGWRHNLGAESAVTMDAAADLALAYLSQGKFAPSEPLAREALEFDKRTGPTIGNASAPRACWAPRWPAKRKTPTPSRSSSKAIKACWRARTESQPRTFTI